MPGRPLIYVTTPEFLTHFGLQSRKDLPGIDDLKAAGLLDPVDLAYEQMTFENEETSADESEAEVSNDYDNRDNNAGDDAVSLENQPESA